MKLKIPHRKEYEPLYREYWLSQNKQDKVDNPRFNGSKEPNAPTVNMSQVNGKMGGRPLKLTKDAEKLNKLLSNGLSLKDATFIMDMTMQALSQIKSKYKLPRKKNGSKSNVHTDED
jgi:hypothetical protein